jgi:hypothetical protein
MDGFSEYLKKISVLTGCKKLNVLQPSDFRSEQLFFPGNALTKTNTQVGV